MSNIYNPKLINLPNGLIVAAWIYYDDTDLEHSGLYTQIYDPFGEAIGEQQFKKFKNGNDAFHHHQDHILVWHHAESGQFLVAHTGFSLNFGYDGYLNNEDLEGDDVLVERTLKTIDGRDFVSEENWITGDPANGFVINFEFEDARTEGVDVALTEMGEFYVGTGWKDKIDGAGGNDKIWGMGGGDRLKGGDGRDFLYGGDGRDFLFGEAGNDFLFGGEGHDRLIGGAKGATDNSSSGRDRLFGDAGNDKMIGDYWRVQRDDVSTAQHEDRLFGGEGNDLLIGDAHTLRADNFIAGGDTLFGGEGNDRLFGDVYRDYGRSYTGGDDKLYGEEGDDFLDGQGGDDTLFGGTGDDEMIGGDGNDVLTGNAGSDTMTGGAGSDTFVFESDATQMSRRVSQMVEDENGLPVLKAESELTIDDIWDLSPTEWGANVAYETLTKDHISDEDVITDFNLAEQDKLDFSGLRGLTEKAFISELSAANLAYHHAIANDLTNNDQFSITFIDPDADGFGEIRIEYNVNGNGWDGAANVFDAAIVLENQNLNEWTSDMFGDVALFSA